MRTKWDYSGVVSSYVKRADYSALAVNAMLSVVEIEKGELVCDVGAGVAHLTLMLARSGLRVDAIEPSDAMRAEGIKRTGLEKDVTWFEGMGEDTGRSGRVYRLVTFGSSFNVCDRKKALIETARILRPDGWFCCMWNYRDLEDPIQAEIESIITNLVGGYDYGIRREDQESVIDASNLFAPVVQISSRVTHVQAIDDCIEAWGSHATLRGQAGDKFTAVIEEIRGFLSNQRGSTIEVPYTTRIWVAQLR